MHRRFLPRPHRFRYRAFWLLIDLAELAALPRQLRLFSVNHFNLISLHETDHGDGSRTPLADQIARLLEAAGINPKGGTIQILCMPRILGYCFNPLSIYFFSEANGRLAAVLYQVHNTFGQRHTYVMPAGSDSGTIHQNCKKGFYVSPFLDMGLRYDFSLRRPGDRVAVSICASEENHRVMTACASGVRSQLTDGALLRVFMAIPFLTLKVTAAIHWEALRLWLKGVRLRRRPAPPEHGFGATPAAVKQLD